MAAQRAARHERPVRRPGRAGERHERPEMPADEMPADEVPADDAPADDAPADEVPADEGEAGEMPAEEVPAEEVPADEAAPGEGPGGEEPHGGDAGGRPAATGRSQGRIPAAAAAQAGLRQLVELIAKQPEGVTGVHKTDGGWGIEVEVVEDRRIPSSADILALYEVETDPDGMLTSYRRTRRYARGRADSNGAG